MSAAIYSLSDLKSPAFWRELVPALSVTREKLALKGAAPFSSVERERERLMRDGYYVFTRVLPPALIEPLRDAAYQLRAAQIPAGFLSLFDPFWDVFAALDGTSRAFAGPDYWVMPNVWAWHLDPAQEEAGWPPHRDQVVEPPFELADPVRSLTFWVALTDTDAENGAISLLPISKDRGAPDEIELDLEDFRSFTSLQVPAGSVIGWHQSVLHWGGRSSVWAETPRVSFSWEVIAHPRATRRQVDRTFTCARPAWNRRLRLVATQILQYDKFLNLSSPWPEWARDVMETVPRVDV